VYGDRLGGWGEHPDPAGTGCVRRFVVRACPLQVQDQGPPQGRVKLTLTSAGKRLAKKGGRVKTTMTVVVKVHGRAVTTRVPVTLSFKKPHRH
jgi:hypothetical protein